MLAQALPVNKQKTRGIATSDFPGIRNLTLTPIPLDCAGCGAQNRSAISGQNPIHKENLMLRSLTLAAVGVLFSAAAVAQDAVKVDPKHYKVEHEDSQVRVLRVRYGPGERSAMHAHPANVAVFLTDGHVKFTLANGETSEAHVKAGEIQYRDSDRHAPENVGAQPLEVILVELKGKSRAKPASSR